MSARRLILMGASMVAAILALGPRAALAQHAEKQASSSATSSASAGSGGSVMNDEDLRIEGEKRFHTNCGRCHQSPHKLPPRMILTIERHMRVRGMLTQEDMRAVVAFLTQ